MTGCRRTGVPRRHLDEALLPVRGKGEAGPDVIGRQVREVRHDVVDGHSGRQVLQHVVHRDGQPSDAGLAPQDAIRINASANFPETRMHHPHVVGPGHALPPVREAAHGPGWWTLAAGVATSCANAPARNLNRPVATGLEARWGALWSAPRFRTTAIRFTSTSQASEPAWAREGAMHTGALRDTQVCRRLRGATAREARTTVTRARCGQRGVISHHTIAQPAPSRSPEKDTA